MLAELNEASNWFWMRRFLEHFQSGLLPLYLDASPNVISLAPTQCIGLPSTYTSAYDKHIPSDTSVDLNVSLGPQHIVHGGFSITPRTTHIVIESIICAYAYLDIVGPRGSGTVRQRDLFICFAVLCLTEEPLPQWQK